MFGKSSDLGMISYPPRVALALRTPGWVSTPRGAVSTRGTTVFVSGLLELELYGRISDPRIILPEWRWLYRPQVGVSTPCWVVSTRDHRFRPRFTGVVNVWKDF